MTSPRDSPSALPISSVMSVASSSRRSIINPNTRRSSSPRSRGEVAAQPGRASCAAATAARASSTVPLATSVNGSAVDGSVTSNSPPAEAGDQSPPTNRRLLSGASSWSIIERSSLNDRRLGAHHRTPVQSAAQGPRGRHGGRFRRHRTRHPRRGALRIRPGIRASQHHRHPLDFSGSRSRRDPLLCLPRRGVGAGRRAAAVQGDVLQVRRRRTRSRWRQGGDHRRPRGDQDRASAPRLRRRGRQPRRPLHHRRGRGNHDAPTWR